MATKLYDPTIQVNDEGTLTSPNSIKADDGLGETKVENMSRGGGNYETVTSQDVMTKKGKVSFELPLTIENANKVKGWKRNPGKNLVELTATADGKTFSEYYASMSVVNTAEKEFGVDAKVSVEMEGAAAQ